ncbi:putative ABC transport system permease protein [Streptococcus porcorum]|uniref:ABC transport system permease protein n=2 Tax=Streptococcus porcorum TaxID=701526 RepID=A0ABV2JG28_9STRE
MMIISTISQGLLWAVLGLGIFMTFRILNFPDMTTEGSFPLGGAVAVTLMTAGVHPLLATLAALLAGCLAGLVTGLLYTKGKIPTLLSGILVMTSCHSIMLMIMGRANLGLLDAVKLQSLLPFSESLNLLVIGLLFVILVIGLMIYFLNTRLGQAYIATGDNKDMAKSFGIDTDKMELMGLVLSNGIVALSGALISQQDGYADVSKGIGVIVIGLASIIIGEVLFSTNLTLLERLIAIAVGSILYQFLILAVIALGFNTNYLKLFSALVLATCLIIPEVKNKLFKGVNLSR